MVDGGVALSVLDRDGHLLYPAWRRELWDKSRMVQRLENCQGPWDFDSILKTLSHVLWSVKLEIHRATMAHESHPPHWRSGSVSFCVLSICWRGIRIVKLVQNIGRHYFSTFSVPACLVWDMKSSIWQVHSSHFRESGKFFVHGQHMTVNLHWELICIISYNGTAGHISPRISYFFGYLSTRLW